MENVYILPTLFITTLISIFVMSALSAFLNGWQRPYENVSGLYTLVLISSVIFGILTLFHPPFIVTIVPLASLLLITCTMHFISILCGYKQKHRIWTPKWGLDEPYPFISTPPWIYHAVECYIFGIQSIIIRGKEKFKT